MVVLGWLGLCGEGDEEDGCEWIPADWVVGVIFGCLSWSKDGIILGVGLLVMEVMMNGR